MKLHNIHPYGIFELGKIKWKSEKIAPTNPPTSGYYVASNAKTLLNTLNFTCDNTFS